MVLPPPLPKSSSPQKSKRQLYRDNTALLERLSKEHEKGRMWTELAEEYNKETGSDISAVQVRNRCNYEMGVSFDDHAKGDHKLTLTLFYYIFHPSQRRQFWHSLGHTALIMWSRMRDAFQEDLSITFKPKSISNHFQKVIRAIQYHARANLTLFHPLIKAIIQNVHEQLKDPQVQMIQFSDSLYIPRKEFEFHFQHQDGPPSDDSETIMSVSDVSRSSAVELPPPPRPTGIEDEHLRYPTPYQERTIIDRYQRGTLNRHELYLCACLGVKMRDYLEIRRHILAEIYP
jgi:hypothetical protein